MESSISMFLDVTRYGRARQDAEAQRLGQIQQKLSEISGVDLRTNILRTDSPEIAALAVRELLNRVKVIPDPEN
jgi:hypothetical protein